MKLIQIARKLERDRNAKIYYCGEAARAIIRRKPITHVELVVRNCNIKTIVSYFKKHFKHVRTKRNLSYVKISDGKHMGIVRLPLDKFGVASSIASLEDDVLHYNFTIDGLYIRITNKSEIIDYVGGREDIKNRIVRTINDPDKAINNNKLLMLQAIALASELNYKLTNNLFYTIKANAIDFDIENMDINAIRKYFVKIVMSSKPSKFLRLLYSTGLLYKIMPELALCANVKQNPKYHKHDVFTHCLLACEYAVPDLKIRLAALLHDVAKAQVRKEIVKNGSVKVTFYKHEAVGYKLAKRILRRLKFNTKFVKEVADLVYNHMYNYDPDSWTDAAVRRFIEKVKIEKSDLDNLSEFPLFLLRRADRLASGANLTEISNIQEMFEKRIKAVFEKSEVMSVKDLAIGGKDLIKEFNLEPGPTIGHLLNYLLAIVIDHQDMNSKQVLLDEAKKYLSEALK